MVKRERADLLLVARGLFESRARAQAAIAAGRVTADGSVIRKPSDEIPSIAVITAEPAHPYVSRGGVKLAAALEALSINVTDRVCLDVGSSTGGFTEVLLARGATRLRRGCRPRATAHKVAQPRTRELNRTNRHP
jgi:23S rRNA (cytidine1920-2'-O)/16S rRNA (cytidine1409-2'-O)-methyltransferase